METMRVVAAIIARDGKVFAAHREKSQCGPGWEFPGGRVEEGESAEQALRREIAEELSARLSTMWLLDTIEHDYPTFHISMDCFVCELLPGEEPHLSEHDASVWVSRDELPDLAWLPADQKVIKVLGSFWDQVFAVEHL